MSETNGPGEPARGDDLMADLAASGEPAEPQGPHRVIGTPAARPGGGGEPRAPPRVIGPPAPAQARPLLAEEPGDQAVAERELPADPEDPVSAKRAEHTVAALFIISMLAGLGFIACYVIFRVHTINNVTHSNLALGLTMAVAFLAMGAGAVIWVRRL